MQSCISRSSGSISISISSRRGFGFSTRCRVSGAVLLRGRAHERSHEIVEVGEGRERGTFSSVEAGERKARRGMSDKSVGSSGERRAEQEQGEQGQESSRSRGQNRSLFLLRLPHEVSERMCVCVCVCQCSGLSDGKTGILPLSLTPLPCTLLASHQSLAHTLRDARWHTMRAHDARWPASDR